MKHCFPCVPVNVNCVSSPVRSKSYMKRLHVQVTSCYDSLVTCSSGYKCGRKTSYRIKVHTWWISPMKWERKRRASVRLSVGKRDYWSCSLCTSINNEAFRGFLSFPYTEKQQHCYKWVAGWCNCWLPLLHTFRSRLLHLCSPLESITET